MLLVGYDWADVTFGILYVSLALLIIVILYRKLLRYLGRNEPNKKEYVVLYAIEQNPVIGEATFYFTSESEKEFELKIQDSNMEDLITVKKGTCSTGGNIIRFDSTSLSNGTYYYCLVTDNQKTAKKMAVSNS